jgi:hypothetical protein
MGLGSILQKLVADTVWNQPLEEFDVNQQLMIARHGELDKPHSLSQGFKGNLQHQGNYGILLEFRKIIWMGLDHHLFNKHLLDIND